MRRYQFLSFLPLLFLGVQRSASAQDVQVPAGTLLRCTLNEPDFSSKTAQVGDPILCHVSVVQEFGHAVFPRGAYMAGHLDAEKEPGHFWGKGYLKLVFDRIGLPNTDVPINAKVIAARAFHVDREGDNKSSRWGGNHAPVQFSLSSLQEGFLENSDNFRV